MMLQWNIELVIFQVAEAGEFYKRLENTLTRYAEKNSATPTAWKFLLDFYTRRQPNDPAIRRPILQVLQRFLYSLL